MATNEERRATLEAMTKEDVRARLDRFGSAATKKDDWTKEQIIDELIKNLGKRDQGDHDLFDQLIDLPSTAEQERQDREKAAAIDLRSADTAEDSAKSANRSADAAEDSAESAKTANRIGWVAIWISVVAVMISIVAIVVAFRMK